MNKLGEESHGRISRHLVGGRLLAAGAGVARGKW